MNSVISFFCILPMLAACTKQEVDDPSSNGPVMAFSAISETSTKGYVQHTDFSDTPCDKLHAPWSATSRTMMLSAHVFPEEGGEANHFTGEVFSKGSDGVYHHNPEYYWPFGSTMDFLAYSSAMPFPASSVAWEGDNCANYVALQVSDAYTQDDILYSSAFHKDHEMGNVPMLFKHSQAWVEFKLMSNEKCENLVYVKDIFIEDVYTTGELRISNNEGDADGRWSFRLETAADRRVDDYYGTYGTPLSRTTPIYLDILLPEQERTAIRLVCHTVTDEDVTYRRVLDRAWWQAGLKYTYVLTISTDINEFQMSATVTDWTDNNIDETL